MPKLAMEDPAGIKLCLDFDDADLHEFAAAMRTNLSLLLGGLLFLKSQQHASRTRINELSDETVRSLKRSGKIVMDVAGNKLEEEGLIRPLRAVPGPEGP